MQTIFVMVKCELGRAYEVADAAVQSVEQVSEVYSISGQYDLIMKFHLDQEVDVGDGVRIRIADAPVGAHAHDLVRRLQVDLVEDGHDLGLRQVAVLGS